MAINGRGRPTKAQAEEQRLVTRWTSTITAYEKKFSKWEERSDKIIKRYRDENRVTSSNGESKFNVLWSNVQTLLPAVFSQVPKPDVSRRFKDNDPVGRVASLLLERALEYEVEHYPDYRTTVEQTVLDRFLGGRGTAWARYEPHMRAAALQLPTDGVEVTEDTEAPQEELDYECAPVDYVHWKDFGHSEARTWEEVTAVWRRVFMTREAVIARFGEDIGSKVPLDSKPPDMKKEVMTSGDEDACRAQVFEIWDKASKKAYWLSKSYPQLLDEQDDPLGLDEFFPCPRPLYATVSNESLIPVPDFTLYQDQARSLDVLAERIDGLIRGLQIKGVYDDSQAALARIFTEGTNGTLIPVKNWAAFAEKNGIAGSIDVVDLKPIYEALKVAFEAVQGILNHIYELTGLSDIVRGQSDPNATATAEKIKGQYASLRLKKMQKSVAQFCTELLQLKAQIICSKFDPQTLAAISAIAQLSEADQAVLPQAVALLIGPERMQDPSAPPGENPMRNFRVEVNSDSMIQLDEQQEKENRNEFIQAQSMFMEKALPLAMASPQIVPLVATLWKFSVQAFKTGKTIEGEFDKVIDQMKIAAAQPQQPAPNPDMERVKSEAALGQQRLQADQQISGAKLQAEQQSSDAKLQFEQQKGLIESAAKEREMQQQMQIDERRLQMEERLKMRELELEDAFREREAVREGQFQERKAQLDANTQVQIAKISSQAPVMQAQNDGKRAEKPKSTAFKHTRGDDGKINESSGNGGERFRHLRDDKGRITETVMIQ